MDKNEKKKQGGEQDLNKRSEKKRKYITMIWETLKGNGHCWEMREIFFISPTSFMRGVMVNVISQGQ